MRSSKFFCNFLVFVFSLSISSAFAQNFVIDQNFSNNFEVKDKVVKNITVNGHLNAKIPYMFHEDQNDLSISLTNLVLKITFTNGGVVDLKTQAHPIISFTGQTHCQLKVIDLKLNATSFKSKVLKTKWILAGVKRILSRFDQSLELIDNKDDLLVKLNDYLNKLKEEVCIEI